MLTCAGLWYIVKEKSFFSLSILFSLPSLFVFSVVIASYSFWFPFFVLYLVRKPFCLNVVSWSNYHKYCRRSYFFFASHLCKRCLRDLQIMSEELQWLQYTNIWEESKFWETFS
jgi:hypothetical protein